MPDSLTGAPERDPLKQVHDDIIFIADERRTGHRQANAFLEVPGWTRLAAIAYGQDHVTDAHEPRTVPAAEREAAAKILAWHKRYLDDVVWALPPLDSNNPASVQDRMAAFLTYPILANLDLGRIDHEVGGWQAADRLEADLVAMLSNLNSVLYLDEQGCTQGRFGIRRLPPRQRCTMAVSYLSPEAQQAGLVYLLRHTDKVIVKDRQVGVGMDITKRSEFIVDLKRLHLVNPGLAQRLGRSAAQPAFQQLDGPVFDAVDRWVRADRYPGINPTFTTLYVNRQLGAAQNMQLATLQEVDRYPHIKEALFGPPGILTYADV